MEHPTSGMSDEQKHLESRFDKTAEDEGVIVVSEFLDAPVPFSEPRTNAAISTAAVAPSDDEDLVVHERFEPAFEVQTDFYGFDEDAPPLQLPAEYYVELPLPQDDHMHMPPPPAPAPFPIELEATNRRPRTRQQRRTESQLLQPTPAEDSKASLRLLMQQLPPPADIVVARIPKRTQRVVRTLPPSFGTTRREENFHGFSKTANTWRKTRASWRHFCLLINGVQQVLKIRFKKTRRVYCLPNIKLEKMDHAYEKPLTFPRPKAQLKRAKREPKVPRPPTRVQPERARALRQQYLFQ